MGNEMFAKFNEMFGDVSKEVAELSANQNFEKKKVPFGDYEVKITKLAIVEHEWEDEYQGLPELTAWFKIIGDAEHDGEYVGQTLFVTKKLGSVKNPSASAFILKRSMEFIESLESGIPVVYENLDQYSSLVDTIFKELDGRAEYQLSFFENKGFKDYAIVKRFQ